LHISVQAVGVAGVGGQVNEGARPAGACSGIGEFVPPAVNVVPQIRDLPRE